jgi:hypothetical protein
MFGLLARLIYRLTRHTVLLIHSLAPLAVTASPVRHFPLNIFHRNLSSSSKLVQIYQAIINLKGALTEEQSNNDKGRLRCASPWDVHFVGLKLPCDDPSTCKGSIRIYHRVSFHHESWTKTSNLMW